MSALSDGESFDMSLSLALVRLSFFCLTSGPLCVGFFVALSAPGIGEWDKGMAPSQAAKKYEIIRNVIFLRVTPDAQSPTGNHG